MTEEMWNYQKILLASMSETIKLIVRKRWRSGSGKKLNNSGKR